MKKQLLHACVLTLIGFVAAASSNAQSISDLIKQHASEAQSAGSKVINGFQNPGMSGSQQQNGNLQNRLEQFGNQIGNQMNQGNFLPPGGTPGIQWPPKTTCPPEVILPPPIVYPPQPCYRYLVYYYHCDYGWRYYGEYHSRYAASQAVNNLQSQGYRAYMRTAQRTIQQGNGLTLNGFSAGAAASPGGR